MSKIIDAEKDPKAAYIVGFIEGEEKALDDVLKILDEISSGNKFPSMQARAQMAAIRKAVLRLKEENEE